jgi:hypothetical protein
MYIIMSETKPKKIEIGGVKYYIDADDDLFDYKTKEHIARYNRKTKTIEPLEEDEEDDENAAYDLDDDNFADEKDWDYVRPMNFAITTKPDDDNEYSVANQSGDIVSYVNGDNYEGTFEDIVDLGMPVRINIEHTYPDVVKVFLNCIIGYNGSQTEGSKTFDFPMYWNGTIEVGEMEVVKMGVNRNILTTLNPNTEKIDTDVNLEEPIGKIEIEVDLGGEMPDIDEYDNEDLQRIVMMKVNDSDFQPVLTKSKVIKSIEDDFLDKVSSQGKKIEKPKKERKPKKEKPVATLTEEKVKELPVAKPIPPPVAVATKVPDELTSKVAEYKSLAEIYKTKKTQYETGKTKELKVEILQIKADIDKLLLEIKALKEGKKEGTGCWKGYEAIGMKKKGKKIVPNCVPVKLGGQVVSLGQPADKISDYDEVYKFSNPKKVQEKAKKYLGDGGVIYRSIKKDKKYMVYNPNTEKWIHFGQINYEDFTKHKDEKRRQNYLKRTANMRGNWKDDKYSANNLSRNLLW